MDENYVRREVFFSRLRPHLGPKKLEAVEAAYAFSKGGHRGQCRDSGERYFEHPKAVALVLISLGVYNWRILVAALLHDLLEDTFLMDVYRVRRNFGKKVALWVEMLTKRPGKDYEAELNNAPWQVLFVKLADRWHNLSTLGECTVEKQAKKRQETVDHYVPLANKLVREAPRKYEPAAKKLRDMILDLLPAAL